MKDQSETPDTTIKKQSIFSTKDCCGLKSPDADVRKRQTRLCGCCCLTLVAGILLLFLVIIPAMIRGIVKGSDLAIESTTISNPTDDSFSATTVQRFSNAGDIPAKAQMKTLHITWNGPGGGKIVKLTDSNSFTVKNEADATLRSTAVVDNGTALTNFNTYAVNNSAMEWTIRGFAIVTFIVPTSVYIDKKVTLYGYDSFPVPPKVHFVNTTGGIAKELYTTILCTLTSVSNIELELGQSLMFHVVSEGQEIGIGEIPNYAMLEGSFDVTANVTLTHSTDAQKNALMKVLSNYTLGFPANVSMERFFLRRPVSWLTPALASMAMASTLPGGKEPSVRKITIYNGLIPQNIPFTIGMYNQLDSPVTFTNIQGELWYEGTQIASVDQPGLNITVPPRTNITSPQLTSQSVLTLQAIAAYNRLQAEGTGVCDLYNTLYVNISGFPAVINYYQYNVTTVVVQTGGL